MCVGAVIVTGGCGLIHDPSTPSDATPTETFKGTLAPQGSNIFTFTVAHAGSVSVTLTSLTPSSVAVGLIVGTTSSANATTCSEGTSSRNTTAGSAAQITVTMAAGLSCLKVYDNGNVTTATDFTIIVTHS
jgi:hypothetical protein